VDPGLHDLGEDLEAALPEPRHLLEHALGQVADHGLVLERPEDLEVFAILRPVREIEARDPADPFGRWNRVAAARVAQLALELLPGAREHRDVELGLVLEIAVEGTLRDAGASRDVVEVRRHEAVAEEDLARRVEDTAARLGFSRLAALVRRGARVPDVPGAI